MQGLDWNTVVKRIEHDDKNKWDETMEIADLYMDADSGKLCDTHGDLSPLQFTEHAFGQLCGKLEIPSPYAKRLPTDILATCVNYDMHRVSVKTRGSWLLRSKGETCRAVLSEQYSPIANKAVFDIIAEMSSSFGHQVRDFWLDETGVWGKVLVDDLRAWDPVDTSQEMKVGFVVGNSEVGTRSVTVEPFIYRAACTNDLVVQTQFSLKQRHVGLTGRELKNRVARSVNLALNSGSDLLDRFVEANQDEIENPADLIERLAKKRKFSQKMSDDVKLAYESEPVPTRFGVVNAFTSVAKQLTGDKRIELERYAGNLLSTRFPKTIAATV